ncbi:MAG: translocation/assembly module TamB domain-containing protein [Halothiobacillaceae bacterium]
MMLTRLLLKIFRVAMWSLLGLFTALVVIVVLLFGSESGTRLGVEQGLRFVPDASVERVQGTLWSGMTIEGLRYQDQAGTRAQLGHLRLEVAWPALLGLRVHLRAVHLEDLVLDLPGSGTAEPDPPAGPVDPRDLIPDLPVEIQLDDLRLARVSVRPAPDARPVSLDRLEAALRVDRHRFTLASLSLELSAPVALSYQADGDLAFDRDLSLALSQQGQLSINGIGDADWSLQSRGSLAELRTTGQGDWQGADIPDARWSLDMLSSLEDLALESLRVETLEGQVGVDGHLRWAEGLDWAIGVALRDLDPGALIPQVTAPVSARLHSEGSLDAAGMITHRTTLRDGRVGLTQIPVTGLSADTTGTGTDLKIESLRLSALEGRADLRGRVDWSSGIDWDARLRLDDLKPASVLPTLDGPLSLALHSRGRIADDLDSIKHETRLTDGKLTVASVPIENIRLAADGDLARTRLERLSADLLEGHVNLHGEGGLDDAAHWSIAAKVDGVEPAAWVEALDGPVAFRLDSQGRYTLESGALSHRTTLQDGALTAGGVSLSDLVLQVTGGLDSARVEHLEFAVLDGRIEGTAEAGWDADAGVSWNAELSGEELNPGLVSAHAPGQLAFALESRGAWAQDGTLTHEGRLVHLDGKIAEVPLEALAFDLSGDLETFRLRALAGRIAGGSVSGQAEVTLAENGPVWDGQLSLGRADLAVLRRFDIDPGVDGWLGLDLSSSGQWAKEAPRVNARLEALRGEISGKPLAGSASLSLEDEVLQVADASVTLGSSRLALDGRMAEQLDFRFSLALPDLAELPVPGELGLAGRLDGSGRVQGNRTAPIVDMTLDGQSLAFQDMGLQRLALSARVDAQQLAVLGQMEGLQAAGNRIDRLRLDGQGKLQSHRIELDAVAEQGRLALALEGGWQDPRWQGQLATVRLEQTPLGQWDLAAPAALTLSGARIALAETCLELAEASTAASAAGRICLDAAREADGAGQARLDAALPLALFGPWLPPGLELPGSISLDGTGRFGETVQAEVDLRLPDNQLRLDDVGEQALRAEYQDVFANLNLEDGAWRARLGAQLPGLLSLSGRLTGGLDAESSLSGRLDLEMPELTWLEGLSPQVTDLAGRVLGRVELGGTLAAPRPVGEFTVQDLALQLPETGVAYDQGRFDLRVDENQAVSLDGSLAGASDGGMLSLTGRGDLSALPEWRLQASVTGEDLPLMRTQAFSLDASPAVDITADRHAAKIQGRIVLPRVEAHVRTLPEGAVTESPDLVIAGAGEESPPPYALTTDLEVVLGDRVTLEGMGFSAGLSGQIRLRGDETAPIAAFGELDIIDGKYAAYGQDLRIDRGRLTFNGPLDDPGLDVRASRQVTGYEAGLELGGTLNHPKSQVYSVPALPESDALSLLLTGRRISEGTSGADANLLVNALAGLGVSQGDDIARDIGQKVGFDEVGLDTAGGFEDTRLTLGKRLNSRLLIRYAVGVFDGVGTVISEYKINRFLDLEISSSAEAQAADLIYRIER